MAIYEKIGANAFGLFHREMTTEEMVNTIAKVPLVFEPGEQYMYGTPPGNYGGVKTTLYKDGSYDAKLQLAEVEEISAVILPEPTEATAVVARP